MIQFLTSTEFIDGVNQYLLDIGLEGTFGQVFLSLMIIAGVAVALSYLKTPRIMVLLATVVGVLMFVSFGWYPVWLVFVVLAALFGYFILNLKGGVTA